jgi:DNA-directed RNA polymerase
MLTFADAKPLGKRGLYWLKVHLANFAGKDKMSFDDRAKYVDDNMEHVRASAKDPFTEDPWWKTLDDPFQGMLNENICFRRDCCVFRLPCLIQKYSIGMICVRDIGF